MVTFTTLAESKCRALCSQHPTPLPGSSTRTATAETRPRRAATISRASLAASAGWEDDLHKPGQTALLTVALAGIARKGINATPGKAAAAARINIRLGFIGRPLVSGYVF
jgi:hypothetical protein